MNRLTPTDLDLLSAAFRRDVAAIDAFRRWSRDMDWDGPIDGDVVDLLPTVHRNVRSLGHDDPLFPRFKGVARKAWVENRRARTQLSSWLPDAASVPLLALPPTALLLDDEPGLSLHRQPLRLATRCEDAARTIRHLRTRDWHPVGRRLPPSSWLEGYVRATDHLAMRRGMHEHLSLTWRLEAWFGPRSETTWARAEPVSVDRTSILALRPNDALEFALRQPVMDRPLPWLVNALVLASPAIGWPSLRAIFAADPPGPEQTALILHFDEILQPAGGGLGCGHTVTAPPGDQLTESPFSTPARWAVGAWRRFRGSWSASTPWPQIIGQLPGYLLGRWHVALFPARSDTNEQHRATSPSIAG